MTTTLLTPPAASTATAHRVPSRLRVGLALLSVYLVWGSTYLAIKVGIETIPGLLLGSVRFTVAGVLLYAFASRRGDRVGDRPTLAQWREATVLGTTMLVAGTGLVAIASERLDSGVAALLVALVPLWMAALDRVLFGHRLARLTVVGLAVGLVGVAILVDPWGGTLHVPSALLIVAGCASWAYGSLRARTAAMPARPLVSTAMQMIAAGVVFAGTSVLRGELHGFTIEQVSGASLAALAYLTVAGSVIAFSAYVWLLKHAPAPLVGTYAYVNPVIAVALGALLLGEAVGPRTAVAGVVIVASVGLIIRARARLGSGQGVLRRLRQSTP